MLDYLRVPGGVATLEKGGFPSEKSGPPGSKEGQNGQNRRKLPRPTPGRVEFGPFLPCFPRKIIAPELNSFADFIADVLDLAAIFYRRAEAVASRPRSEFQI
jgi:hypothetical protein